MKKLALIILTSVTAFAYRVDTTPIFTGTTLNRKTVPWSYLVYPDLTTQPIPLTSSKIPRMSFLTTDVDTFILGDLRGKTITATFTIETSGTPVYAPGYTGGCANPVSMRLFFSTQPGYYNLSDADHNDTHYWWASGGVLLSDVDDGGLVTLTLVLDPADWQDANGHWGLESPAYANAFNAAASQVAQIGFSFGGGCFFDTGVGMSSGAATIHLKTFDVQ